MQKVRTTASGRTASARWRRSGRRCLFNVVLEVYVVPKRENPGYLWSYAWSIPLTPAQAQDFFRVQSGAGRGASTVFARLTRRAVATAARNGLPFGPGTLADYVIVPSETVLRVSLATGRREK